MDKLPIYEITIDEQYKDGEEDLGMDMIAFTSNPAIIVKGVAFNSQAKLHFADDKKYRITAPIMIPMDIYRRDDEMGEYEVRFTPEVIDSLFSKFMQDLRNRDLFNLEHGSEKVPAYILEAWQVDNPKEDKAYSTFGIEVPKGTIMVTTQITDKEYYNELVNQNRVGFSIEGFLGLKSIEELTEQFKLNSMNLPDGNYTDADGKVFSIVNGELVEDVQEQVLAEEPEKEPEVEVEVEAEVQPEEEKEVDMEVNPETDAEAILAIVAPLLDERINEVLQVIADLKNAMDESVAEAPAEEMPQQMSASHKYSNLVKFIRNGEEV